MWHLDTDIVIALVKENRGAEIKLTACFPRVAVSAIALAEARFGVLNSARVAENDQRLRGLLELLNIVSFDERVSDTYAQLRVLLERRGKRAPAMDLLIAATAVAHNAVLVTHNTQHFESIEGLQLEDWLT